MKNRHLPPNHDASFDLARRQVMGQSAASTLIKTHGDLLAPGKYLHLDSRTDVPHFLWEEDTARPDIPTAGGLMDNRWQVPACLAPGATYHWQVTALNTNGWAAGPLWGFTTTERRAGDMNGDGGVDLGNLVLCLRVLSGQPDPRPVCTGGDIDGDGTVGVTDSLFIPQQLTAP